MNNFTRVMREMVNLKKKFNWLALFLSALLFLLSACASTPAAFDTEMVSQLAQAGVFSEELEPLDADIAFSLYLFGDAGLERESLKDAAVLRSAGATCEEAAVLIFTDEETAKQAELALQVYLTAQVDANRSYRPEEIPKLEDALVSRRGPSVLLAVCADTQKARETAGIS